MRRVALLLGGNIGPLEETFEGVKRDLECEVGEIVSCSEQLLSQAWGFCSEEFLNEAVVIDTSLEAEQLLDAVQLIEERWGRDRLREDEIKREKGESYCARTIDIDIILFGQEIIQSERLIIPHPLMGERKFVLEPLSQVLPLAIHPVSGKSIKEMLEELNS
ncbi:MAG: 2-amino-4-hydroxy-6-hydroxymethyldihydropteridine diphosphokinase [Rikenellaceae bacterium]